MMNKRNLWIVLVVMLSACGGADSRGFVAITVENARAPKGLDLSSSALSLADLSAESLRLLEVNEFRVTVSAEDIADPIVVTASGTAQSIEVMQIPKGENRRILIEAYNPFGTVIRRRRVDGVKIKGGITASLTIQLHTVPLVLNLRDDAVVMAHHLNLMVFGEPDSSIALQWGSSSTTAEALLHPSLSSGVLAYQPSIAPLGRQTLSLVDQRTGESSSINLTILEQNRPGRGIFGLGQVGPSLVMSPGIGSRRGVNFPELVESLTRKQTGKVMP